MSHEAQFQQIIADIDALEQPSAPEGAQAAPISGIWTSIQNLKAALTAHDIPAIGKAWFELNDAVHKLLYGDAPTDGGSVSFAPVAKGAWLQRILDLLEKLAPIVLPLLKAG